MEEVLFGRLLASVVFRKTAQVCMFMVGIIEGEDFLPFKLRHELERHAAPFDECDLQPSQSEAYRDRRDRQKKA